MKKKPLELKKLDAITWLLDPFGHRGEGRTHTMMIAYVNIALGAPTSDWIIVRDHFPTRQADSMLLGEIKRFCTKELPDTFFEFNRDGFRVKPSSERRKDDGRENKYPHLSATLRRERP